ncbi:biliverdin-producing heme oxygenase [Flavisphingomonas formosensis]|uniref:biliverdin-producing heme oxygenase n=1 Tax=Flavisphingomonas formosensis TaxID=861534 RepID=UPI0018DEF9EA|nr:biliverdin-producing heme oxygenase [Sphingomonas formosensis]
MKHGPRFALRDATAGCHERVDAAFGRFDLADRAGYGRFLSAHARAFLPAEAVLDAADTETVLPDWSSRRRADRLRTDMAVLEIAVPPPLALPPPDNPAAIWGMLYVLEGSRLGGAMLSRRIDPRFPKKYLNSDQNGADWRNFLRQLEVSLDYAAALAAATIAAETLFALFEQAAWLEWEAATE